MNSWQEAAGSSASPTEHMPDCAGVALAVIKDVAPAKKKAEANSILLPISVFHKVKAQGLCELLLCTDWIFLSSASLMGSVTLPGCLVWCTDPTCLMSVHLELHKR